MYSNCAMTSFKHLLFLRIFEVFNEIEIEIKVINNKIFTKLYLKIRIEGKEIS